MQYGLAAWGLREETLESQLAITSEFGLDLLEFSIANYEKDVLSPGASNDEIEEVKKLFKQHGIRLECGCTGNDFTGDDVDKQISKVIGVINIAAKLGIQYLRIFAGFSSDSIMYGERLERLLTALKTVNDYAINKNVILCVETHGGVTASSDGALIHFNSATTRVDIWRKLLETGVSITYDPANLAAVGYEDPVAFFQRFKEHISYIHLKDFRDVPGGVMPAACGEGRLNWSKLMTGLKNFDGPAMIEYELTNDIRDGIRRSLDFLKHFDCLRREML